MAADELAAIGGHKPKVLLRDGESREAKSSNSHAYKYSVKRQADYYYCHCPAWRNQACTTGVPVNARTCKHLGEILGNDYEAARLELKNPNANGKSSTSKPGSSKGKRKRDDEDEDEEADSEFDKDDEEDEDEDEPPQKKRKPTSKGKKGKIIKKSDSDDDDEDAPRKKKAVKPVSKGKGKAAPKKRASKKQESEDDGEDFSDAINAISGSDEDEEAASEEEKPKKKAPVKKSANAKDKVAPKKQAAKRMKEESDDEQDGMSDEEESGKKRKKPASKSVWPPVRKAKPKKAASSDEEDESPKRKKPAAKGKKSKKLFLSDDEATEEDSEVELPPKKKRKGNQPDSDEEEDEEEEDVKPPKKARKLVSKAKGKKKQTSDEEDEDEEDVKPPKKKASKPVSKPKGKKKQDSDEDDAEEDAEDDEDAKPSAGPSNSSSSDPLAKIDGHKPKVLLADGEDREVKSLTSNSVYKIKRTWDHYYCQCPAWRNQAGAPVDARTCKHLRELLGDTYETARLKWRNPNGPAPKPASKAKPKSKSKKKKAATTKMMTTTTMGPDPTGWWISEKLDGVRTFYDGKGMVSRLGNPFTPPQWFLDKLPKNVTLDGELFGGRGKFQDTVSIVKTQNSPHWKEITFQIFDVPSEKTVFEDRVAFLQKLFGPGGKYECPEVVLEVEELGGEGLMLRKAKSNYEGRRSATLLKIKTFYDAEAESGKTFNVGSGFTDKQRQTPPKVGTIITYRFQELTRDGVPRFPTFVGEAIDKKKAKDAKFPAHRKAGGSKDD
ncbi:hypothetical protein K438DRAFT_2015518 [Mycena galopus ATCC 62051]|nr:hypothetical protein K438DRAFT_2015518 [Mycena galopus ATCC 62051]